MTNAVGILLYQFWGHNAMPDFIVLTLLDSLPILAV